jgi:enoyl-[acyl-carrier protein] reductase II
MAWVTRSKLAAAVSEAGGLGTIGPEAGARSQEEANDLDAAEKLLRAEIHRVKALTNKPFAVNFPIGRGKQQIKIERQIAAAINEGIKIAIVSMGSPELFTQELHGAGAKVIHVVASVKQALKAEEAGVDAVACVGCEGGGHLGVNEIPTFVLVPQIVDAIKIPVIAGGGIADARGFVAALALGAEGVYMGTRFLATQECDSHPNMKEAVLAATDTSTVIFGRKTSISRCIKNDYSNHHMKLEASGASFEELRDFERSTENTGGWRRVPAAVFAGNTEHGSAACGAIAGIINDIPTAKEVIDRMVGGYEALVATL